MTWNPAECSKEFYHAEQSHYSRFIQKAIESVGGTYNPEAAAHMITKDGRVGYIMRFDKIQGLTADFITFDEIPDVPKQEDLDNG